MGEFKSIKKYFEVALKPLQRVGEWKEREGDRIKSHLTEYLCNLFSPLLMRLFENMTFILNKHICNSLHILNHFSRSAGQLLSGTVLSWLSAFAADLLQHHGQRTAMSLIAASVCKCWSGN